MLNQETKRKIDSARQILVGKVPDPKAQVEQITTALIYKFMDDMDKEAQELGGKARFFTNGYQKYAWTKLMDAKLGGQNRLNLYVEAITTLSQNPHLPQLFRDIFKDAFLPYRDPETLNLFLKEINSFTYDHSEDLGDAFEYLLSILGSQGEAGQFRTPRHIIDFIVSVVDPKKEETILDPACGTAGFLISAYKHILKQNHNKPLTPDEKKKLMENLVGYDISPDMVRLSRVNMYLHSFPEPKIYEYDSLTSEDKWEETFDVIMANPPFMTPKGGIRPHKRFAIQASRAEVLFVDYIIEHLKYNGRAGVIVPEGVLANTNASYFSDIRKLLIEDNIWAIVSLHSFVFAPYAEVTTFILFIDKALSKKAKKILFCDIKEDGFDKSDQRRKIEKNDIPNVYGLLLKYRDGLIKGEKFEQKNLKLKLIDKKLIEENGTFILLSSKYEDVDLPQTNFPLVEIKGLIEECKEKAKDNKLEVWSVSNKFGFVPASEYFDKKIASENTKNYKIIHPGYFAFNPSRINVGSVACNLTDKQGIVSPMYTVFKVKDDSKIDREYLLSYLKSDLCQKQINQKIQGATRKVLKKDDLEKLKIPLPSIDIQRKLIIKIKREQSKIIVLQNKIKEHGGNISSILLGLWDK